MRGRSTRIVLVAVGALAGSVGTAASARAAASCSVEALNVLHVPDVSVTDAKPMAAAGTAPAYCDVQGTVVTKGEGVADGLARFEYRERKEEGNFASDSHLLRKIDRFVDLTGLRAHLGPY